MEKTLYFKYKSSWGEMLGAMDHEAYLKGLWFFDQKHFPKLNLDRQYIEDTTKDNKAVVESRDRIIRELVAYQKGELKEFNIPIKPEGTAFQKKVWKALLSIPYGETRTYGEISRIIAKVLSRETMSAQAIGQAVGRNPISIIIPCHRVVGNKNQLTGYAGGIEIKRSLLQLETKSNF